MPIKREFDVTYTAPADLPSPAKSWLPERGHERRGFEYIYDIMRRSFDEAARRRFAGRSFVWGEAGATVLPMEKKVLQPTPVPAPSVPTVPRASVPSVQPVPIPRGEPVVLTGPPIAPGGGMIVKVDPNNPGRYIIYMPDGREYPNSSREFVEAAGMHLPDDPSLVGSRRPPVSDFDLGDVLLDVARTVLPRAVEEWVGITPPGFTGPIPTGYGGPAALPAPVGVGGGGPGIPPGYGSNRREPVWRYDGWVFKDGKWVRSRRRRRRKLLTEGDFNSLLKIQTLKNTDNIKIGLSKALR